MGQFVNSIGQVAKNYKNYDAWEQNQADIKARKEALTKKKNLSSQEQQDLKKRAETVIRAAEIMDARSEDNCEDMEQLTGMAAMVTPLGIQLLQIPVTNKLMQWVDAKYTPKKNELAEKIKSAKNVDLADAAKKEFDILERKHAKAIKNVNKYTGIGTVSAMFLSAIFMILWGNRKQKEASRIGRYQAKQNELKGLENFVTYTPEQLEQAQKIAETIPDEKEKKSLTKIISELKEMHRDKDAYKAWLAQKDPKELEKLKQLNLSDEVLEKAQKDKELIVNIVKDVNIKAEEYSENLENAYDTFSTLSWLLAAPIGFGLNAVLKACNANPKVRKIASIITPLAVSLGISMHGTIAQKQAARVGRYQARKDLIENPAVLMNYSDEDMETVKDVKADKQKLGFFQKLGQNFKFLGTYFKDKKEYDNYKKTVKNHNEKLQKAFKQIELSDEQKKDAKLLQTNVFRAFDEIDEISQRYSEDVEAGCEIAKESANAIWSFGSMGALALAAVAAMKGKLPIVKWGNKLVNWTFNKESSIKQGVNNLYEALNKKGNGAVQEFQKALANKHLGEFINKSENAEIKTIVESITGEVGNIMKQGMAEGVSANKNITEVLNSMFGKHLKQTKVAKWLRGLIQDILKLKMRAKSEDAGVELTKEVKEALGLDFNYKNYKTLINTCAVGFAPILGLIFGVPYAFNAWLTNIQKKAGKIGVMQAVDNLDDPRVFADVNS